jgi:hypothetical protein
VVSAKLTTASARSGFVTLFWPGSARFRLTEHPVLVAELAMAMVGMMNKRAMGAKLLAGSEI